MPRLKLSDKFPLKTDGVTLHGVNFASIVTLAFNVKEHGVVAQPAASPVPLKNPANADDSGAVAKPRVARAIEQTRKIKPQRAHVQEQRQCERNPDDRNFQDVVPPALGARIARGGSHGMRAK